MDGSLFHRYRSRLGDAAKVGIVAKLLACHCFNHYIRDWLLQERYAISFFDIHRCLYCRSHDSRPRGLCAEKLAVAALVTGLTKPHGGQPESLSE